MNTEKLKLGLCDEEEPGSSSIYKEPAAPKETGFSKVSKISQLPESYTFLMIL